MRFTRNGTFIFIFLSTMLLSSAALAVETELEIAKAIQNPLKTNHYARHIDLPLENDTDFGYGPRNNVEDLLNFKPVVPFKFTSSYDLIVRTIAPVYVRTSTLRADGRLTGSYINGWGDLNPTFFISPALYEVVSWGIGPTLSIPTSTNNKNIGTGKWSIGPELAVMAFPGKWVFGVLTYNYWSFAGDANRKAVDQFSFQYYVSYNFNDGWYLTSKPEIIANWKKPGNQQWTVPFGLGAGRAFHWGNQPMSLSVAGYYNVVRPTGVGPSWQLQLSYDLLIPVKLV